MSVRSVVCFCWIAIAFPGLASASNQVERFDLPPSEFLSKTSREAIRSERIQIESFYENCSLPAAKSSEFIKAGRTCAERHYYPRIIASYRADYDVHVHTETIAGVTTDTVVPANGISGENAHRILINLHEGDFKFGARLAGQIESIPVAALGQIKVVSVYYRMAPEATFPAAVQDVDAVYRGLLRTYRPEHIGIYGCFSGGLLVSQFVASLLSRQEPLPGAIGMLCGGSAANYQQGDSHHIVRAMKGSPSESLQEHPYFSGADVQSPLVFPAVSSDMLKDFPPSLFITSTRDFALSAAVHTHSQLFKLGVKAELHVWEGLDHGFIYNPALPESHDAFRVVVEFFKRFLGPAGDCC